MKTVFGKQKIWTVANTEYKETVGERWLECYEDTEEDTASSPMVISLTIKTLTLLGAFRLQNESTDNYYSVHIFFWQIE